MTFTIEVLRRNRRDIAYTGGPDHERTRDLPTSLERVGDYR